MCNSTFCTKSRDRLAGMSDKLTKSDKSPEQRRMRKPETTLLSYESRSMGEHVWGYLKSYAKFCVLAFKEEFGLIGRHKLMKWLYLLIAFIVVGFIGDFLGIPLVELVKPIFNLLSLEWWIRISLAVVILFLLFIVDGSRRFNERTVRELNDSFNEQIAELQRNHERDVKALNDQIREIGEIHYKELDRQADNFREDIEKLKTAHKSEIRELKEQHESDMRKLAESNAMVQLALLDTHKKEIEINKKLSRSIFEGQLKREEDNRKRNNILRSSLLHKIREQASQLEELKKLKLIVNTYRKSEILIEQSADTLSITAYLYIHLENNAQYPIRVKSVGAAIFRKTKRGIDKKIRKSEALILPLAADEQIENLEFKAGVITPPSWLVGTIAISPRYGKRLNPNCFLRVTMEALTQPPYTVDLDVNWELARIRANSKPVYFTPRRSALYQAHKLKK